MANEPFVYELGPFDNIVGYSFGGIHWLYLETMFRVSPETTFLVPDTYAGNEESGNLVKIVEGRFDFVSTRVRGLAGSAAVLGNPYSTDSYLYLDTEGKRHTILHHGLYGVDLGQSPAYGHAYLSANFNSLNMYVVTPLDGTPENPFEPFEFFSPFQTPYVLLGGGIISLQDDFMFYIGTTQSDDSLVGALQLTVTSYKQRKEVLRVFRNIYAILPYWYTAIWNTLYDVIVGQPTLFGPFYGPSGPSGGGGFYTLGVDFYSAKLGGFMGRYTTGSQNVRIASVMWVNNASQFRASSAPETEFFAAEFLHEVIVYYVPEDDYERLLYERITCIRVTGAPSPSIRVNFVIISTLDDLPRNPYLITTLVTRDFVWAVVNTVFFTDFDGHIHVVDLLIRDDAVTYYHERLGIGQFGQFDSDMLYKFMGFAATGNNPYIFYLIHNTISNSDFIQFFSDRGVRNVTLPPGLTFAVTSWTATEDVLYIVLHNYYTLQLSFLVGSDGSVLNFHSIIPAEFYLAGGQQNAFAFFEYFSSPSVSTKKGIINFFLTGYLDPEKTKPAVVTFDQHGNYTIRKGPLNKIPAAFPHVAPFSSIAEIQLRKGWHDGTLP